MELGDFRMARPCFDVFAVKPVDNRDGQVRRSRVRAIRCGLSRKAQHDKSRQIDGISSYLVGEPDIQETLGLGEWIFWQLLESAAVSCKPTHSLDVKCIQLIPHRRY